MTANLQRLNRELEELVQFAMEADAMPVEAAVGALHRVAFNLLHAAAEDDTDLEESA